MRLPSHAEIHYKWRFGKRNYMTSNLAREKGRDGKTRSGREGRRGRGGFCGGVVLTGPRVVSMCLWLESDLVLGLRLLPNMEKFRTVWKINLKGVL